MQIPPHAAHQKEKPAKVRREGRIIRNDETRLNNFLDGIERLLIVSG